MAAIEKLSKTHAEHISQYGTGNEQRLTGKHETCDINTFRFGVADRGSSIRIPLPVQLKGYGYLEDRRPAANVSDGAVAVALACLGLLMLCFEYGLPRVRCECPEGGRPAAAANVGNQFWWGGLLLSGGLLLLERCKWCSSACMFLDAQRSSGPMFVLLPTTCC